MTHQMIVEAIRTAQSVPSTAEATGAAAPVADPETVARFAQAMAIEQAEAIPFADKISTSWRSAQENHQSILHRIKALAELGERHSPSAAELVELQYEVHNLAFQQEVVAKVADKSANAIQTLIKNQ